MAPELLKSLRIKGNVVRRILKELELYRREETEEMEKVQNMKATGADPFDIKYAVRSCVFCSFG
jgi:hypothetical protein